MRCEPHAFGPLNRFCGNKKHFPFLKRKLQIEDIAPPITDVPQKSGSKIASFFASDRKIANNPKQICTKQKTKLQIPSPQPKARKKRAFFFCQWQKWCEMRFEPHELRSMTEHSSEVPNASGSMLAVIDGNILRHFACPPAK